MDIHIEKDECNNESPLHELHTYITQINRNRTVLIDVHIQEETITYMTLLTFNGPDSTTLSAQLTMFVCYAPRSMQR